MDLERDAEGVLERSVAVECQQRARPHDGLAHAGRLVELLVAELRDGVHDPPGDLVRHARHPREDDLVLALRVRVVDPVVQAPPLERVVQLARAVRRQDDGRLVLGGDRPQLGDRHGEVGEELEEERLELVVGAVDLVDEQHGRPVVLERLQQRALHEEAPREQVALLDAALRGPDREELAGIVPVVDRVVQVDALVALQADEPRARAVARARATSVLPTPASPSSSSGWSRASARRRDVARARSARYP